jgi:hypothetical protein
MKSATMEVVKSRRGQRLANGSGEQRSVVVRDPAVPRFVNATVDINCARARDPSRYGNRAEFQTERVQEFRSAGVDALDRMNERAIAAAKLERQSAFLVVRRSTVVR